MARFSKYIVLLLLVPSLAWAVNPHDAQAPLIQTPTVTAGGGNATATLIATCTSPGCQDINRLANAANAGRLTLTTAAAAGMADGQDFFVVVNTSGTAPTDITWVAGAAVTLKSGVIGLTAANLIGTTAPDVTARNTACGTPPSTGSAIFKWNWNATSGNLRLLGCTVDPPGSVIPVALGGLIGSTIGPGFDFVGTVPINAILAYTCVYTMTFPAALATPDSKATCGTSPGQTDTYTVKVAGASKGTFTLSSATPCVADFTGIASGFTCTAGQRLEIDGPGSFSTTAPADVAITLAGTR